MTAVEDRAKTIFLAALERAPDQLLSFLDEACGGDAEVRARVDQLLRAHDALGSIHVSAAPAATVDLPAAEAPGAVIGPYKLVEPIGEGGMGSVWMAQQTEPVKRLVAVKLVKAGMDSKQVIARFEAERQALALMDHPNIAKVLDAGATAEGRPYFVMDLVKGVPITRYCDEHHLTPRQRLELFIPVCQAVQHAHQKGIIHRDIKPSNVLVALYDGRPVPKVIDFGVAKAAGQPLTDKTLVTGFGNIVGTPEYMSPEQAEINQLDIDTRSDIYSLGVLLYELLTGGPPFSRKDLEKAGVLEMLRVIREEEPSKPSTKLSTAEGLPTLAANRGTEPAKLTRLVRGELDWIAMKALEKDRNRRYETATGFAADVQRYLADEPVLACPPSAAYRVRKFARRNRSGLAVAGLVLFFLVLLGSGAGWTWRDRAARAREAELERAAREAERASNLERAVERAELLHREGKRGEALAALERARLLAREATPPAPLAERIESLQQLLDAEGRDEVFVARFEVIRREEQTEVDVEKSEFRQEKAYPKLREALEQYGLAVSATPPDAATTHLQKRPLATQAVVVAALDECLHFVPREDAGTREWLIEVLQKADSDPWRNEVRRVWKQSATLEALAKDIDVRQQPPSFLLLVVKALPITSPRRLELARRVQFAYPGDFWANHELGRILWHTKKHAEAVRYHTAALSLRPDNPGVLLNRANALQGAKELDAAIADLQRAIALAPRYATAHYNLGNAHYAKKDLPEAIAAYRKTIELDPKNARTHNNLGWALQDQGKRDEAIASYKEAIKLQPSLANAYFGLGIALRDPKELEEAIACFQKTVEIDPIFAPAWNHLGVAIRGLRDQKRLDEAITWFRKAMELSPQVPEAYIQFGYTLTHQKRPDEAIEVLRKGLERLPDDARLYLQLARVLWEQKRLEEAAASFRRAINVNPSAENVYYPYHYLGCVLNEQKKPKEAAEALRNAIDSNPKYAPAHYELGVALDALGQDADAIASFRQAIELDPKQATALNNLAWRLVTGADLKARNPQRAIVLAKIAAERVPHLAWNTLGVAQYRAGDWKAAREALDESVKVRKGGDSYDWFFLAMTHWQMGNKEQAREWYGRAVAWMDTNRPKNEGLRNFRAEAAELMSLEKKKH